MKILCWVVKYVLELVGPCENGVLGGEVCAGTRGANLANALVATHGWRTVQNQRQIKGSLILSCPPALRSSRLPGCHMRRVRAIPIVFGRICKRDYLAYFANEGQPKRQEECRLGKLANLYIKVLY